MSEPVRQLSDVDVTGPAGSPSTAAPRPQGTPFVVSRDRGSGSARQRIVDVARELFCTRGYERTPLRAVSESVGVSKAAIYYHFKAKEELLAAIVGPFLDRVDDLLASAGPHLASPGERRDFLAGYVVELATHAGIAALLLRDPGVGEHPLGSRFVTQHSQMRALLGAGDDPASVIRTTTALRALELAVVEFADAHPDDVREVAVNIAIGVLESGVRAPG